MRPRRQMKTAPDLRMRKKSATWRHQQLEARSNPSPGMNVKDLPVATDALCRLVETLQRNPLGAMILVLLAAFVVAAGWTWRR